LAQRVANAVGNYEEETLISNPRHLHALQLAQAALADFFAASERGEYDECLAFELQNAARALSGILGTVDQEDLLDKIFSEFCLGK